MHPVRPTVVTLALLAATACSSSSGSDQAPPATSPSASATSGGDGPAYVALGDSYTAGPQLAETDARSGDCLRSTHNYPHLLATAIGAKSLTDVSCSGATTDNVLEATPIPGTTTAVKAQLDAVSSSTTLVTVGIGGNDSGLFSSLSRACITGGTACEDYLRDKVPGILKTTQTHVEKVLAAVRARAPKAKVVLVGYLGVTPDGSGCDALGGAALDTRGVSAGEKQIDATLEAAAKESGVTYVSMNAASQGHDACAGAEAWTNGLSPQLGHGAPLHPDQAGMKAVAAAVEKAL